MYIIAVKVVHDQEITVTGGGLDMDMSSLISEDLAGG